MNSQDSSMAANAICHAANMAGAAWQDAASHYSQNHVIYRPRLFQDGNQWCALFGDDLQSGVAGFGDSPAEAMWDFDKEWHKKIEAPPMNTRKHPRTLDEAFGPHTSHDIYEPPAEYPPTWWLCVAAIGVVALIIAVTS